MIHRDMILRLSGLCRASARKGDVVALYDTPGGPLTMVGANAEQTPSGAPAVRRFIAQAAIDNLSAAVSPGLKTFLGASGFSLSLLSDALGERVLLWRSSEPTHRPTTAVHLMRNTTLDAEFSGFKRRLHVLIRIDAHLPRLILGGRRALTNPNTAAGFWLDAEEEVTEPVARALLELSAVRPLVFVMPGFAPRALEEVDLSARGRGRAWAERGALLLAETGEFALDAPTPRSGATTPGNAPTSIAAGSGQIRFAQAWPVVSGSHPIEILVTARAHGGSDDGDPRVTPPFAATVARRTIQSSAFAPWPIATAPVEVTAKRGVVVKVVLERPPDGSTDVRVRFGAPS